MKGYSLVNLSRSGDRRLNNVGVGPYHTIFLIRGQRLPGHISWKENLYFQSSVVELKLQEHNSKHLKMYVNIISKDVIMRKWKMVASGH